MEHVKIFYKCSSSKSNRNNRNRKIICQLSNRKKMDVNDSPNIYIYIYIYTGELGYDRLFLSSSSSSGITPNYIEDSGKDECLL